MVYRRRQYRRRRPFRKRRTWRRRRRRTVVPRNLRNTGYLSTKQVVDQTAIIPSGALTTGGHGVGFTFALADITQVTTFSKLFDSYRITGVSIKMLPATNYNTGSTNPSIRAWSYIDLDDGTAPATIDEVTQRSNAKSKFLIAGSQRQHSIFVRPRWSNMAYQTATGSGYTLGNRKAWLDCADTNIPHHAVKYFFETTNNATPLGLSTAVNVLFTMTYYIQFKGLR